MRRSYWPDPKAKSEFYRLYNLQLSQEKWTPVSGPSSRIVGCLLFLEALRATCTLMAECVQTGAWLHPRCPRHQLLRKSIWSGAGSFFWS